MAAANRTPEQVRLELESEREGLAQAVDSLRAGVKEATDVSSKVRANLPVFAAAAAGVGFLIAGGIGATIRLLARREQEEREVWRVGRFSVVDREEAD
jgi:hypothetical protein